MRISVRVRAGGVQERFALFFWDDLISRAAEVVRLTGHLGGVLRTCR